MRSKARRFVAFLVKWEIHYSLAGLLGMVGFGATIYLAVVPMLGWDAGITVGQAAFIGFMSGGFVVSMIVLWARSNLKGD